MARFIVAKADEEILRYDWLEGVLRWVSLDPNGLRDETKDRASRGKIAFHLDHMLMTDRQIGRVERFYLHEGDLAIDVDYETFADDPKKAQAINEIEAGQRPGVSPFLVNMEEEKIGTRNGLDRVRYTEYDIIEVSSVTIPAYNGTEAFSGQAFIGDPRAMQGEQFAGDDQLRQGLAFYVPDGVHSDVAGEASPPSGSDPAERSPAEQVDRSLHSEEQPPESAEREGATMPDAAPTTDATEPTLSAEQLTAIGQAVKDQMGEQFSAEQFGGIVDKAIKQRFEDEEWRRNLGAPGLTPVSDQAKADRAAGKHLSVSGIFAAEINPAMGQTDAKTMAQEIAYAAGDDERREQARNAINWDKVPEAGQISGGIPFSRQAVGWDKPLNLPYRHTDRQHEKFAAVSIPPGNIPDDTRLMDWIEYLYPVTPIIQYCSTFTGLMGDQSFPRSATSVMGGSTGAAWLGRGNSLSDGTPALDEVELTPRTIATRVKLGLVDRIQFGGIMASSLEQNMRMQSEGEMMSLLQGGVIAGSGASNQPRGAWAAADANKLAEIASNASWTLQHFYDMREKVMEDNALRGSLVTLVSPDVYKRIGPSAATGLDRTILEMWRLAEDNGVLLETNHLGEKRALFGNFADTVIGYWDTMVAVIFDAPASGERDVGLFHIVGVMQRHDESYSRVNQA